MAAPEQIKVKRDHLDDLEIDIAPKALLQQWRKNNVPSVINEPHLDVQKRLDKLLRHTKDQRAHNKYLKHEVLNVLKSAGVTVLDIHGEELKCLISCMSFLHLASQQDIENFNNVCGVGETNGAIDRYVQTKVAHAVAFNTDEANIAKGQRFVDLQAWLQTQHPDKQDLANEFLRAPKTKMSTKVAKPTKSQMHLHINLPTSQSTGNALRRKSIWPTSLVSVDKAKMYGNPQLTEAIRDDPKQFWHFVHKATDVQKRKSVQALLDLAGMLAYGHTFSCTAGVDASKYKTLAAEKANEEMQLIGQGSLYSGLAEDYLHQMLWLYYDDASFHAFFAVGRKNLKMPRSASVVLSALTFRECPSTFESGSAQYMNPYFTKGGKPTQARLNRLVRHSTDKVFNPRLSILCAEEKQKPPARLSKQYWQKEMVACDWKMTALPNYDPRVMELALTNGHIAWIDCWCGNHFAPHPHAASALRAFATYTIGATKQQGSKRLKFAYTWEDSVVDQSKLTVVQPHPHPQDPNRTKEVDLMYFGVPSGVGNERWEGEEFNKDSPSYFHASSINPFIRLSYGFKRIRIRSSIKDKPNDVVKGVGFENEMYDFQIVEGEETRSDGECRRKGSYRPLPIYCSARGKTGDFFSETREIWKKNGHKNLCKSGFCAK